MSTLWPWATIPRQARPCSAGRRPRPLVDHAGRAQPERAHHEWARPERCCGETAGGSSMAGTRRGLRQNHLRGSAFLLLHQNRRGETRKGVLTGGVLETVENGGIDEGNQHENEEELLGSVLQLQRKKVHMRRRPDQATGVERRGGEFSPADGGRRCRDLRLRPKEWSRSCKNWGKKSVRSWRNSMHEESTNGGRS
jgi:hypothetical protein